MSTRTWRYALVSLVLLVGAVATSAVALLTGVDWIVQAAPVVGLPLAVTVPLLVNALDDEPKEAPGA